MLTWKVVCRIPSVLLVFTGKIGCALHRWVTEEVNDTRTVTSSSSYIYNELQNMSPWSTLLPVQREICIQIYSIIEQLIKIQCIGLFKIISRWTSRIFNAQIQSKRGLTWIKYMFQNKDKDLPGIYKYGCDPLCVSLLTDRHLKVLSNTDFEMISRQRRVYACT